MQSSLRIYMMEPYKDCSEKFGYTNIVRAWGLEPPRPKAHGF